MKQGNIIHGNIIHGNVIHGNVIHKCYPMKYDGNVN